MAIEVLQYPFINGFNYALTVSSGCRTRTVYNNSVFNWLLFGKLPEEVVVTAPRQNALIVEPTAKNKYLASVTITPSIVYTAVTVVAEKTDTTQKLISGAATYTVDNTAIATATGNPNLTITGVAAGQTMIRVFNSNNQLIQLISVTVTATS